MLLALALLATETIGLGSPAIAAPGGLAAASAAPAHPIEVSGYVILGGNWVQEDPAFLQVGRNNGFTLADARLELTGRPLDTVWIFLSFDGAVPLRSGTDPLDGRRAVDLKDAYAVWAPGGHLRVQAGQFKAPQDLEELVEETEVRFPTRSIVSVGVTPPDGYAAEGLALDRQLGIGVGTDSVALPFGAFAAQVAVMNGNGPNQLANDTQAPSVAGRFALGIRSIVNLGVDAYFQPRSFGDRPNLFRENRAGVGGDVAFDWNGVHALALVQWRNTVHVTAGGPDAQSFGYSVEGAYRFRMLEPAVRYASLDPNSLVANARVDELTLALNLYAAQGVRFSIAYAHRGELAGRDLQNDAFQLAAQARF